MTNGKMEVDELWDFLNTDEEAAVDPSLVEFEGFAKGFASGFIAPWNAAVLHAVGDENDYDVAELGYTLRRKAGSWGWFYYFDKREVAVAAKQQLGKEFDPNAEWCYWCMTADVLNFASEETRAKFGDDLFYSGRATGVGSRKYGSELHQVMLPSAVAAVATASGIDNPGYDLSLLNDLGGDSSEDECHRLVGGGDVKLEDAVLWQQRAELWAALGESDPKKSQMIEGGKHATASKTLSRCLSIFYLSWKSTPWARVVPVPNPRPDAVSNNTGNRLSLPALVDVYSNQAMAQEAAGSQATSPAATDGIPPIPTEWQDMPEDFKATVLTLKEKGANLPAFVKMGGETAFLCTFEEVQVWFDHV